MQIVDEVEIVESPLLGDRERRRWYADGGGTCLVLTELGELLEPFPTFGPSSYRRLARKVSLGEADAYASSLGFAHQRTVFG